MWTTDKNCSSSSDLGKQYTYACQTARISSAGIDSFVMEQNLDKNCKTPAHKTYSLLLVYLLIYNVLVGYIWLQKM